MSLLFYKKYIQKVSVVTLVFLSLAISTVLALSSVGTAQAAPSAYLVGEGRGTGYTYYPNGFAGSGVRLSTMGMANEYVGAGSTYAYKAMGSGEEDSNGTDATFGRVMHRTNKSNLEDLKDWRFVTDSQITMLRGGTDYTFLSRADYDKEKAKYDQSKRQEDAGNQAYNDTAVAGLSSALSEFKSKLKQSCGGMANEQACVESHWKAALSECFNYGANLEEDQTRGSAEQTEKNHKQKFANCLSGKLNGISAQRIVDKLNEGNVSITNLAKEASDEKKKASDAAAGSEDGEEEPPSCNVDGIGWLLCPTMNFLAGMLDTSFNFLASTFLETEASLVGSDSVRTAWSAMRNLANIAFVIAFLFIIYSQLTGAGIGNYGVKKMLPRIIIAAILVNVSFIICQLAVDISNLLGYSLKNLFDGGLGAIRGDVRDDANVGQAIGGALSASVLMVGILAAGVGLLLALSMPVILAALIALFLIVLILVGRQAILVLLTVISPIAFVAFLLPNTEQYFKKWYKMFFALLMVFPIIGVVFGASNLAAQVINEAAIKNGQEMMQIVALGVAALPLFVVPSLLKGSLAATGALGAKLSGMSGKATARVGKKAMSQSRLGDAARNMKYKSAVRQANRRAGNGFIARTGQKLGENGGNKLTRGLGKSAAFLGGGGTNAFDNSKLGTALGLSAGADNAQVMVDEMFEKDVKAAALSQNNMTKAEKMAIITGATKATRAQKAAAQDSVMTTGGFSDRQKVLEHVSSGDDVSMKARAVASSYAKGDGDIYGKGFGDNIINGTIKGAEGLADSAVANAAQGKLQADHVVSSAGAAQYLAEQIAASGNSSAQQGFMAAANTARTSESTQAKIVAGGELDQTFNNFASAVSGPKTTTATTPSQPSTQSTSRGSGPTLRGGETTTESGFIVPRDMNK